jgi:hypothetical protein
MLIGLYRGIVQWCNLYRDIVYVIGKVIVKMISLNVLCFVFLYFFGEFGLKFGYKFRKLV